MESCYAANKSELEKIIVDEEKNKLIKIDSGDEFEIIGIGIVDCYDNEIDKQRISDETFEQLAKDGFNTIRYCFSASLFYDFNSEKWNMDNLRYIADMCDRAKAHGLYVIMDMHTLINTLHFTDKQTYAVIDSDGGKYQEEFVLIWGMLAKFLKNKDNVLAYSLMNEPAARVVSENQLSYVCDNYRKLIQNATKSIRRNDSKTIICIQKINIILNGEYVWQDLQVGFESLDGLDIKNMMLDVSHIYPECTIVGGSEVFQRIISIDTTYGENEYANSTSTYVKCDIGKLDTLSCEMQNDEDAYQCIDQIYLTTHNGKKLLLDIKEIRIYVINKTTSQVKEILKLNDESSIISLNKYGMKEVFQDSIEIISNRKNTYFSEKSDGKMKQQIVLKPHERLRVEVDFIQFGNDFIADNFKTLLTIRYKTLENSNDILISPEEQVRQKIESCYEIAKKFNSPLYLGEFCINNKYINTNYNYQEYAVAFNKLCKEYSVNRIWHRMTEYPVDNGYGCYYNKVASESTKRKSMWKLVMPLFLNNN